MTRTLVLWWTGRQALRRPTLGQKRCFARGRTSWCLQHYEGRWRSGTRRVNAARLLWREGAIGVATCLHWQLFIRTPTPPDPPDCEHVFSVRVITFLRRFSQKQFLSRFLRVQTLPLLKDFDWFKIMMSQWEA